YCAHSGRSSPQRARNRATVSGFAEALSPSWASTGSAGTVWATRKTTRVAATAMRTEPTTLVKSCRIGIYAAGPHSPPERRAPDRGTCATSDPRIPGSVRRLDAVEVHHPARRGQLVSRDGLRRRHPGDGLDEDHVVRLVHERLLVLAVVAGLLDRVGLATGPRHGVHQLLGRRPAHALGHTLDRGRRPEVRFRRVRAPE